MTSDSRTKMIPGLGEMDKQVSVIVSESHSKGHCIHVHHLFWGTSKSIVFTVLYKCIGTYVRTYICMHEHT